MKQVCVFVYVVGSMILSTTIHFIPNFVLNLNYSHGDQFASW